MGDVDPEALRIASVAMLETVRDIVVERIEEHRDELIEAFAGVVSEANPRVCASVSRQGASCDRAPGHVGSCSWEFDDIIRRYRSFEETAAKVPDLTNQLADAAAKLTVATRLVAQYQEHTRWRP
jgi:hypothetical protein